MVLKGRIGGANIADELGGGRLCGAPGTRPGKTECGLGVFPAEIDRRPPPVIDNGGAPDDICNEFTPPAPPLPPPPPPTPAPLPPLLVTTAGALELEGPND